MSSKICAPTISLSLPPPSNPAFLPPSLFLLPAFLPPSSIVASSLPLLPRHHCLTLSPPATLRYLLSSSTVLRPHLFPALSSSPRRGHLHSSFPPLSALLLGRAAPPCSLPSTAPQVGAPPLRQTAPSLPPSSPSRQPLRLTHSLLLAPSTSSDPFLRHLSSSSLGPPGAHPPFFPTPSPPSPPPDDATPQLLYLTITPPPDLLPALNPPPLAGTLFPHR